MIGKPNSMRCGKSFPARTSSTVLWERRPRRSHRLDPESRAQQFSDWSHRALAVSVTLKGSNHMSLLKPPHVHALAEYVDLEWFSPSVATTMLNRKTRSSTQ